MKPTPHDSVDLPRRRVHHLPMLKQRGKKIVMVTAYDYPTGLAADKGGADVVLVGDSLGMVALGFDSTIPVTMDMMVHHCAAVRRAVKQAFLVCDMPFLSYTASIETAVLNAGRLVQEGGAEAVKLEGGVEIADAIRAITHAGIPVIGHVGLQPQSVHKLGGYKIQGRNDESAEKLLADAAAVEQAGAVALVVEATQSEVAIDIVAKVSLPVIGIGAGGDVDGQVLVISDLTGLTTGKLPKFARQYSNVMEMMVQSVADFASDVRTGKFPEHKHQF